MSAFETGNKMKVGPDGQEMTRTMLTTNSLMALDLADPKPEAICIEDIAHGLSMHVRWAGQGRWLSVAQHSVMVMRVIEDKEREERMGGANVRLLRKALMHDAHEAYIGDLSGGLKYLLRESVLKTLIADLDNVIEQAIPQLDMSDHPGDEPVMTAAEERLIPIEYNYLFRGIGHRLIEGPLCQQLSEELFLGEVARLEMVASGS